MTGRLGPVRAFLKKYGHDGLLVTAEANVRYLSGFSGTECRLLITATAAFFLGDFRYLLQAEKEVSKEFEIVRVDTSFAASLAQLFIKLKIRNLCFEEHHLTVGVFNRLRELFKKTVRFIPTSGIVEHQRQVKTSDEIACLRKAAAITRQALRKLQPLIKPGVSELALKHRLEQYIISLGAEGPSFDSIVASGPNGAMPHAKTTDRRIRAHEPVIVDCGAIVNGYKSDLTRTFFSGSMTQYAHYYRLVETAQKQAMQHVRPGRMIGAIDRAARQVFEKANVAEYFGHALGHGVGLEVHEAPTINSANRQRLRSGVVITIEPGLYMPKWGGIRIEDMVLVTRNGYEVV